MALTHTTTTSTSTTKPGLLSRLRNRHTIKVTTHDSTNSITGTHTRTQKTKTHPEGIGHRDHGGRGPLASTQTPATASHTTQAAGTHHSHHQQLKPTIGDRISGAMMRLRGNSTGRRA
ncbi:hypothetical protein B0A54_00546 [Friedmanniomyces endolithicus]|uniref:Uncharacterized protein n=1 Tax=Friedmanniomyces endolithicus TaxID=329885 RepID=A0A4U0VGS2_9PEZI|nr:hypothetical protein LTS09_002372 [Friedmanniomyces endolithicus]TKA48411.1 hypothetical protein B0A54_00546 [Friedmanniomyces endolithicus]